MILVVLFSIHSFLGSVFILPHKVVKEVDKKCREYLWGTTTDKKKVALIFWDRVCVLKNMEVLTLRELECSFSGETDLAGCFKGRLTMSEMGTWSLH